LLQDSDPKMALRSVNTDDPLAPVCRKLSSKWNRRNPSTRLLRGVLSKDSFLSKTCKRKCKLSRFNRHMLSSCSRRNNKYKEKKIRRPVRKYTMQKGAAIEFLDILDQEKRKVDLNEGMYNPTMPRNRNDQTCELKDIVPYLLNKSPEARRKHDLVSDIANCIRTFWLGSLFIWEIRPKYSNANKHEPAITTSKPYRERFRFPNDPITAPITSQLSENCVVDLICNQGRKVTLVLWMRKSYSVKFLGHIPERVRQIPFAEEVTGMTYDLKRRLLWIFGNRRLIAFHVNADPGCISIVYSLCHRLGNLAMEYDPEHDYLVGSFGSFLVTLRQKDS